jgi:3-dehydroquinate synthase
MGVERGDHVIALGGGVIGDLVGFAASILKRGCGFVQVPTTLLAQVDSSVGGKTAINTRAGKNLIGAFHQPAMVLIDPATLDTLPLRELRAGYAEVVKYGLIDDANFFAWCEANGERLLAGDAQARVKAISHSVGAKARIVAADERETTGTRALLNLGHTFGHALEAETGFSDRLLHGEGVAAGMALAFAYSARRGLCPAEHAARVAAHLRSVGLPDGLKAAGIAASGAQLVEHMRHDKKMDAGTLPFLLARGIGQTFLDASVDLADVAAFLDEQPR